MALRLCVRQKARERGERGKFYSKILGTSRVVVVHAFDLSTQEAAKGRQIPCEFKAILNYRVSSA